MITEILLGGAGIAIFWTMQKQVAHQARLHNAAKTAAETAIFGLREAREDVRFIRQQLTEERGNVKQLAHELAAAVDEREISRDEIRRLTRRILDTANYAHESDAVARVNNLAESLEYYENAATQKAYGK